MPLSPSLLVVVVRRAMFQMSFATKAYPVVIASISFCLLSKAGVGSSLLDPHMSESSSQNPERK
jgi:hypothetical protein